MLKRLTAWFLAVLLSLMLSAPAFASATPSDADISGAAAAGSAAASPSDAVIFEELGIASSSDAQMMYDSLMQYSNISLMSAGEVEDVANTVDLTQVWACLMYYGADGTQKYVFKQCDADGDFSMPKPSDYSLSNGTPVFYYQIRSGALPSAPGKYLFSISFISHIAFTYTGRFEVYTYKSIDNSVIKQNSIVANDYCTYDNAGQFSLSGIPLDTSGCGYIQVITRLSVPALPYGGRIHVRFVPTSEDPVLSIAGSASDNAQQTADNTTQIAQNTSDMNDTLKEIVQTISNQLEALWDQMYNYMHLRQLANDDKNTQQIINKLDQDLSVEIQNQNDNTETIINGYDSSSADADNDRLQGAVDEYDAAEGAVFDQVKDSLSGYSFEDFSSMDSSVLAAVRFSSGYLQDLFVSIGIFNSPVTVALTLTIAMMLVGYYRVKGG